MVLKLVKTEYVFTLVANLLLPIFDSFSKMNMSFQYPRLTRDRFS